MDDKTIEMVLKKVIQIDVKTSESFEKTNMEIEQREIELKELMRKRIRELELIKESEGKNAYDEIIKRALIQKDTIINECNIQLEELDKLLELNKNALKEKVFKKLSFK